MLKGFLLGLLRGVARCVFIVINTLVQGRETPLKTPKKGTCEPMGRPKLSPQEKRDCRVQAMFTMQERAELEARAEALGLSLSEFIRRRTLGVALPPNPPTVSPVTSWPRPSCALV